MNRAANVRAAVGSCDELDLLLCCARTRLDAARAARIKELVGRELDWKYMFSRRRRIIPLLYHSLNAVCPEAMPKTVRAQLHYYCATNAKYNDYLSGELLKLIHLLDARAIPFVPYKGPIQTLRIYRNTALREFRDLDILVRKQDVLRVKDLLIAQGFVPCAHPALTDETATLEFGYNFQFVRTQDKVAVEVHWAFVPKYMPFPLALEEVWERLEPIPFQDTQVLSLCPEDLLLALCLHGYKDVWEQLKMVCDVAELISAYGELNWENVVRQALDLGCERVLFLGLLLASELLDASLPKEVLERIHEFPVVRSLAIKVARRLFHEGEEPIKAFAFHVALMQ
jgi:hypothetical protein